MNQQSPPELFVHRDGAHTYLDIATAHGRLKGVAVAFDSHLSLTAMRLGGLTLTRAQVQEMLGAPGLLRVEQEIARSY